MANKHGGWKSSPKHHHSRSGAGRACKDPSLPQPSGAASSGEEPQDQHGVRGEEYEEYVGGAGMIQDGLFPC